MGVGLAEQHAAARDLVEVRRFRPRVAVATEAIGPGRVEGDEENAQRPRCSVEGSGAPPREKADESCGARRNHDGGDEGDLSDVAHSLRVGRVEAVP